MRSGAAVLLAVVGLLSASPAPAAAPGGEAGKLGILLLGDSTTIGSVCRHVEPESPHLEDVIRLLLAAVPDLSPAEVINQGRDGEFIRGPLSSGSFENMSPLGYEAAPDGTAPGRLSAPVILYPGVARGRIGRPRREVQTTCGGSA
jgi:hypothetical protein